MAVPVNITANQQLNGVGAAGTPFSCTVSTTGSAIVVYVAAYRATTTGELVTAPTATGLTFALVEDDSTVPVQARALKATDSGGGSGRVGHYWWIARNVAAGSHSITVNFVNASANFASAFACEVPRVPTTGAYCDIVANHTQVFTAGVTSVTVASGGNFSAPKNTVLVAASGIGTNTWNGAASADNTAPTGFVRMRAWYDNFPIVAVPYQASYADVDSIAAQSATWIVTDGSLAEGYVATMVVLRDSTGGHVEVLLDEAPGYTVAINGSTGWDAWYTTGDPRDGTSTALNLTAQATGEEVRIPAVPPGAAVGSTVTVKLRNAALAWSGPAATSGTGVTTGWITGTVRAGA